MYVGVRSYHGYHGARDSCRKPGDGLNADGQVARERTVLLVLLQYMLALYSTPGARIPRPGFANASRSVGGLSGAVNCTTRLHLLHHRQRSASGDQRFTRLHAKDRLTGLWSESPWRHIESRKLSPAIAECSMPMLLACFLLRDPSPCLLTMARPVHGNGRDRLLTLPYIVGSSSCCTA